MKYTKNRLKEISFPLGGIGTGSIGLAGNGSFIDWEIFNRPSKGSINAYSHFAVRAIRGDKITARVLNGDLNTEYTGQRQKNRGLAYCGYGFGADNNRLCGFPHFKEAEFNGEFPIATLKFSDATFPADVTTTAFNPFIPRDAFNSSIPAAFFEIEIKNTSDDRIKYQTALSVSNPFPSSINRAEVKNGCHTITMYHDGADKNNTEYGDLTVATDAATAYTQTYWYRGAWNDKIVTFWNEFSSETNIRERVYETAGQNDACTLFAEIDLLPKQSEKVRFVLSWNVPNNHNYWSGVSEEITKPWKNYYATVFENSVCSALYSLEKWDFLYGKTLQFKTALHEASLPSEIIDAASANLSVLKSPTVLRLEDGSFYGWEGVQELLGSCEGTCQHVWNYAYALCFLFPELERSIRDLEFKYSTDENGRMGFRLMIPLERKMTDFRSCVDGQTGTVLKCYREWKISGDNEWLKDNWNNIKKVLEYAWNDANPDAWDRDKDGVLEGRQHHTLDMELFGPSSWLEGMYLAALKAAAEMADFLGDAKKAEEYKNLFDKGYEWTKNNLFNGRYFIQKIDLSDKTTVDKFDAAEQYWNFENGQIKYQIANGSSIDQLLAQWHARLTGLGYIFDKEQISIALDEMMKINYKPSMRYVVNPWRVFSINDEAGSVICAYPNDVEKPKIPVPYCEETMTGFEYSFAGLLCAEGKIEEGLLVAKSVRNRFDGEKRNPWNEFECGSNYARSMSSYALIPILSGFEFDMPHKHIGFNPYKTDYFKCVWSLADAWGNFEAKKDKINIPIYDGKLTLRSLGLKFCRKVSDLRIDGKKIEFTFENGVLHFDETTIYEKAEIYL